MELLVFSEAFGCCCAFIKIVAQVVSIAMSHFMAGQIWQNEGVYVVIVSLIVLPISLRINQSHLTKVSLLGNLLIPLLIICLITLFIYKTIKNQIIPITFDLFIKPITFKGCILSTTAILEAFVFQKVIGPIFSSLKERKNKVMMKNSWIGVCIVAVIYILVGTIFLLIFGKGTSDNIIGMFRTEILSFQGKSSFYVLIILIILFSIFLLALLSLPVAMIVVQSNLSALLYSLKKINYPNPEILALKELRDENTKEDIKDEEGLSIPINRSIYKKIEIKNKNEIYKISQDTQIIASVIVLILILIFSLIIKEISSICYFTGAIFGNLMTIILPSFFIIKFTKSKFGQIKFMINSLLILIGTIILIAYIIVLNIEEDGFKKPTTALENYSDYKKDYDYKKVPFFTIIYSSQLEKGKNFGIRLKNEAMEKYGIDAQVINIQHLDTIQDFNENKMLVFIVSTWAKGMATDDSYNFKEMVSGEDFFTELKNPDLVYTIFGIGNSYYEKEFNPEAKYLDDILSQNKIKKVCDIGLGDEIGDLEKQYKEWKENIFWPKVIEYFNINFKIYNEFLNEKHQHKFIPEEYYTLQIENKDENLSLKPLKTNIYDNKIKNLLTSTPVKTDKIVELRNSQKYGSVLKVTFDLNDTGLKYETGNTVGIFPKNSIEKVEFLAKTMGYDLNKIITYSFINDDASNNELQLPYPNGYSIREALSNIIDLNCQITEKMLGRLCKFITDEKQFQEIRDILLSLKRKNYNLIDFVTIYDSVKIPFEQLHKTMPIISPRFYIVASSPNLKKIN